MRLPTIRQIHTYFGALIAPSLLFFALTGAVQLLGLHEAHGDYHPPRLVEQFSSLHKDQRLLGPPTAQPVAEPSPKARPKPEHKLTVSTIALKLYFLVVAMGLIFSTILGLWIGFTRVRGQVAFSVVVLVGAILPLVLFLI